MRGVETETPTPSPRAAAEPMTHTTEARSLVSIDVGLVALFLCLTFLLGIFPLKDADIYWHLRTGQIIRQTGSVPRADIFTYTRAGAPWIDLHWIFQVGASWLHERGGAQALNLAKCILTTAAMLVLILCRKRDWPMWVIILAWLPALLVLSGRMYVRPETLTLVYLAWFLAVLFRWRERPWLAFTLPIVQVAWVNSHGLFVLGPIVLVFALIDEAIRPGAFSAERKPWRRKIALASFLTLAACLANPYGLKGAIYPLELAQTISNPVFSRSVAELTPVLEFVRRAGWNNLPLQLHMATMVLGALSFVIPTVWTIGTKIADWRAPADREPIRKGKPARKARKGPRAKAARDNPSPPWPLSPFRLLLYAAFSILGMQATRNTHQFAAVVGAVTAWNFAEWAASIAQRGAEKGARVLPSASSRLLTAGLVAGLIVWVAMGSFYRMTGEGRTVALGEEPLWFPHAAARFAGEPDMPDKFLSFHNGHASLFEYYHGPERKVFTDPRLEVAGAQLFEEYTRLETRITQNQPGWEHELDQAGRPVVLVDHEYNAGLGAAILASDHWRCVWFDSIAAVFIHDSYREAVRRHAVNFGQRHFARGEGSLPSDPRELRALAKALGGYVMGLSGGRPDLSRPMAWLGLDAARRLNELEPSSALGWKITGELELFREAGGPPAPRFRSPYDPVFDLSAVRATYALQEAHRIAPGDFMTLVLLRIAFESRQMHDAVLEVLDRTVEIPPINLAQQAQIVHANDLRKELRRRLGSPPSSGWRNLSELDQAASALLGSGRSAAAAELLESALPTAGGSWPLVDAAAVLRLHLGEPARARALWERVPEPPSPAVRDARIATTFLVEGDFTAARRLFEQALKADPKLFEAHYSLAVLEQDAGNAQASYAQALVAVETAPNDADQAAARAVASSVARFARSPEARENQGSDRSR